MRVVIACVGFIGVLGLRLHKGLVDECTANLHLDDCEFTTPRDWRRCAIASKQAGCEVAANASVIITDRTLCSSEGVLGMNFRSLRGWSLIEENGVIATSINVPSDCGQLSIHRSPQWTKRCQDLSIIYESDGARIISTTPLTLALGSSNRLFSQQSIYKVQSNNTRCNFSTDVPFELPLTWVGFPELPEGIRIERLRKHL